MRASSCACMKRFSKMVSVMKEMPSALGHQRHELGLQIGGEAGMLLGGDIDARELARRADAQRIGATVR